MARVTISTQYDSRGVNVERFAGNGFPAGASQPLQPRDACRYGVGGKLTRGLVNSDCTGRRLKQRKGKEKRWKTEKNERQRGREEASWSTHKTLRQQLAHKMLHQLAQIRSCPHTHASSSTVAASIDLVFWTHRLPDHLSLTQYHKHAEPLRARTHTHARARASPPSQGPRARARARGAPPSPPAGPRSARLSKSLTKLAPNLPPNPPQPTAGRRRSPPFRAAASGRSRPCRA
eukprot:6204910-Pleurochrysis_carterae.AAC.1